MILLTEVFYVHFNRKFSMLKIIPDIEIISMEHYLKNFFLFFLVSSNFSYRPRHAHALSWNYFNLKMRPLWSQIVQRICEKWEIENKGEQARPAGACASMNQQPYRHCWSPSEDWRGACSPMHGCMGGDNGWNCFEATEALQNIWTVAS